jgi:hypothetical protein
MSQGLSNLNFPRSGLIKEVALGRYRLHKADGDSWPTTWAADGNLYGGAGDNQGSPMNFWRIEGHPAEREWGPTPYLFLVDNLPLDPQIYCRKENVHPKWGIKPASLLGARGRLYAAVELMNFGDNPDFNRQHNIQAWIITSDDYGRSWNRNATPQDFFTGRLAAPHFLQFGQDYAGRRDDFVYAYFSAAEDGNSYWENGDFLLLGRVGMDRILDREAWEFCAGIDGGGVPTWSPDESAARPVFCYFHMTGENHVSYDRGIKRYLMGNYGFTDLEGNPRPYHQGSPFWDPLLQRSQLTLFEAPEPWGPWSIFHRDDDWGQHGGYNPSFPTKWMSEDGRTLWMVYSGSEEDYNFTLQKVVLGLDRASANGR